ncbi:LPS-assembly lipoprotein LptE [Candidatus Methylospira mobilis]|nr:LPS assembly lipoprotein LptE [Candidatus Methylospira mobilis]
MRFSSPVLLLLIAVAGASCGFHLRNAGLNSTQSFYVEGMPYSDPLVLDITKVTATAGGQVTANLAKADGVIHIHRAVANRRGMTLSQFGQTTMYELSYRVVYDIRSKSGEILVPQRDLEVVRDYYNSQTSPLSQAQEEGVIQQEMRVEAAQLLIRQTINALDRKKSQPTQPPAQPQ